MAADKIDYKSTSGYVFKLSGDAVNWSSKKQATVAKSTTEAEYMALSLAMSETIWLKGLHNEIANDKLEENVVYCDNKGAIDLAKNTVFHPKTKRIGTQHHFVCEKVWTGEMIILKIA